MTTTKQILTKTAHRVRRHRKIRTQISGTDIRPRLAVFRSNKHISAQLIDDVKGFTLASATDIAGKGTKVERAIAVGKALAISAKTKGITSVVFDRGGFLYAGRVKALAEAARTAGLQF